MTNCTFPVGDAKEFDRICTSEILPAILKAYGTLASMHHRDNDALLICATKRLKDSLLSFCDECCETYTIGQPTVSVENASQFLEQAWATRDTCSKGPQVSSRKTFQAY